MAATARVAETLAKEEVTEADEASGLRGGGRKWTKLREEEWGEE